MEKYHVLKVEWRSAKHTVGFVAYATLNPANEGEWNSVVGYRPKLMQVSDGTEIVVENAPEDFDAQYIAASGAKLEWQLAHILFPTLDITKHKYYTGVAK